MRMVLTAIVLCAVVLGLFFWLTEPPAPPVAVEAPPPPKKETVIVERDVTPPRALPGPRIEGPVTRMPPRAPQTKPILPPEPPEPEIYHRVIVASAGELRRGKRRIGLSGIDALAKDATCDDGRGGAWPCGRIATAQLRMLIRRKAVECDPPLDPSLDEGERITRHCKVGTVPIAAWLVEQGWAIPDAEAGEDLRSLHEHAKKEKRGQFSTPALVTSDGAN